MKYLIITSIRPYCEKAMRWFSYVHQFMDVDDLVKGELDNLLKYREHRGRALANHFRAQQKVGALFDGSFGESTEFTVSGDNDLMMGQTLDFQNDESKTRSKNIETASGIEEGWMLYNVFSLHLLEQEKVVVHTCDLAPDFLKEK